MCGQGEKHHRNSSLLIRVYLLQIKASAFAARESLTETCATVNTNMILGSNHILITVVVSGELLLCCFQSATAKEGV